MSQSVLLSKIIYEITDSVTSYINLDCSFKTQRTQSWFHDSWFSQLLRRCLIQSLDRFLWMCKTHDTLLF
jgi:hypothetical protein